jgi:molybdopterin converting factor small subunit
MAKVKYFGILAENVDQAQEEVKVDSENLEELVAQLKEKHSLEAYDFQIAVNRKIILDLSVFKVRDSDEIAFLPAFAGG